MDDINPTCDFCDKSRREVAKIFKRNEAHICIECVRFCLEIYEEELAAADQAVPK